MKPLAILLTFCFFFTAVFGQTITVTAGSHGRMPMPVTVKLQQPLSKNNTWHVVNKATGTVANAQPVDRNSLLFVLPDTIPAGSTATYLLRRGKAKNLNNAITIAKNKQGILIKAGRKPVLQYNTETLSPPAGAPEYYKRSGFIHPLYSPSGKILTDGFPEGHMHQHAIFMAWVNTSFKNDFTDFWNQQKLTGTIEHINILSITQGPVFGKLEVMLRHKSLKHGEVLREKWTITCYAISDHFLFDLESEQVNTGNDTLFLKKYLYGGMAFRGSAEWNPDDSIHFKQPWHLLTSEGKRDTSANHTHARWVDAYGKIGKGIAGAAVMNHSSNFRYPQAIRVHPTMPYWVYAPVVDDPFYIAPAQLYRSKFRYYVHDGMADVKSIEKMQQGFVDPPKVEVSYGE